MAPHGQHDGSDDHSCPMGEHSALVNQLKTLTDSDKDQWEAISHACKAISGRPGWLATMMIATLATVATFFGTYWMAGVERDLRSQAALVDIREQLKEIRQRLDKLATTGESGSNSRSSVTLPPITLSQGAPHVP